MKKKFLLALMLFTLTVIAFGTIGASAETVAGGECGDELTWTLDNNGKLVISGTGTMYDYGSSYKNRAPWYGNTIETITIEDGVSSIGECAFYNCYYLSNITIPNSITVMGNNAFLYCERLTEVNIFDIAAWCNINFNSPTSNPLYYAKKLYLNNNLVTNLTIPNSIVSIAAYTFYNCESLIDITLPNSVTEIGDGAFHECTGITTINNSNNLITIGDLAFYGCIGLKSIIIPDGVTNIGKQAFSACRGLVQIKLSDSLTFVDEGAFSHCEQLTNVSLPKSIETIGNDTFYFCSNLVSVTFSENLKSIGADAFAFTSITSISLPETLTFIGEGAFQNCLDLESVYITNMASYLNCIYESPVSNPVSYANKLYLNNELVKSVTIPNSVTEIPAYAFSVEHLDSIFIPANVVSIGKSAFSGCRNLANISIPSSVMSIGENAFSGCSSLKSINIPDSVASIGSSLFYNCDELLAVSVGNGVETIPEELFYKCRNLKYVCLPQGIKYINNDAFNSWSSIEIVFYAGSEAQWDEILFYSGNENLTNAKMVYNATQKIYKFETNCDAKLSDITDYAIFTMPTVQISGMTLSGWYDNAALTGEPVSFPYYGDATTLYAAWTDRTGKTFDDAFIAKANREYTVTTTENGQLVYFEFVPSLSKEYRFYSTGSKDTYAYLYNSNKTQITSDDDDGDGNNFYISYKLTAGQTYYIAAKLYSGTGTFTFVVEEPVDYRINEITIKDMSGNNLQAIPAGTFLATVSFTNVSSSADTVIILAQYTDAGAFKGLMYIQTEDVPTGSTIKLSIPVDNLKGDVATLKAFCWESFSSLTPLGNSVSFPSVQ